MNINFFLCYFFYTIFTGGVIANTVFTTCVKFM